MSRAQRLCLRSLLLTALVLAQQEVFAHPGHAKRLAALPQGAAVPPAPPGRISPGAKGVTGQGALRFRVLVTSASLPEAARKVLTSAHGGFAVDRRPGKGDTYFALPGAGILRVNADMEHITLVQTSPEIGRASCRERVFRTV